MNNQPTVMKTSLYRGISWHIGDPFDLKSPPFALVHIIEAATEGDAALALLGIAPANFMNSYARIAAPEEVAAAGTILRVGPPPAEIDPADLARMAVENAEYTRGGIERANLACGHWVAIGWLVDDPESVDAERFARVLYVSAETEGDAYNISFHRLSAHPRECLLQWYVSPAPLANRDAMKAAAVTR
jgi:hypothetical protein